MGSCGFKHVFCEDIIYKVRIISIYFYWWNYFFPKKPSSKVYDYKIKLFWKKHFRTIKKKFLVYTVGFTFAMHWNWIKTLCNLEVLRNFLWYCFRYFWMYYRLIVCIRYFKISILENGNYQIQFQIRRYVETFQFNWVNQLGMILCIILFLYRSFEKNNSCFSLEQPQNSKWLCTPCALPCIEKSVQFHWMENTLQSKHMHSIVKKAK